MTAELNAIPDGLEIPVEYLDAPQQTRVALLKAIWTEVVRGISYLEHYSGIVDRVSGLKVTGEQERAIVEYVLNARRAQQATFTELPESKLNRAFAALREARIVAEQDFTCCGSCGVAEIGGAQAGEIEKWLGYVFYHQQDTDTLVESATVYINYGIFWPAHLSEEEYNAKSDKELEELYDELTLKLMNEVVIPILTDHGIGVEWNQQLDTRIMLTDATSYLPID